MEKPLEIDFNRINAEEFETLVKETSRKDVLELCVEQATHAQCTEFLSSYFHTIFPKREFTDIFGEKFLKEATFKQCESVVDFCASPNIALKSLKRMIALKKINNRAYEYITQNGATYEVAMYSALHFLPYATEEECYNIAQKSRNEQISILYAIKVFDTKNVKIWKNLGQHATSITIANMFADKAINHEEWKVLRYLSMFGRTDEIALKCAKKCLPHIKKVDSDWVIKSGKTKEIREMFKEKFKPYFQNFL